MLITIVLGFITGLLAVASIFMPTLDRSENVYTLISEMIVGAKAFTLYFPIDTLVIAFMAAIGFEISLYTLAQLLKVLNWVRGSGELNINK